MMSIEFKKTTGLSRLAVAMVALMALGACETPGMSLTNTISPARGPVFDKYPVQVVNEEEGMTLVVKPHIFTLSRDDRQRVALLAETYKHVGHGDIWVVAPVGSANSAASIGAAAEIAKVMVERGVRPQMIRMNSYQASETNDEAPVTILYKRYHAYTQECGNWSDDVAVSPMNTTSRNFGCATSSNIAAMVEDPYDLVKPQGIDPADPARRSKVFENYRAGVSTSTARSADESGAVSDVAN